MSGVRPQAETRMRLTSDGQRERNKQKCEESEYAKNILGRADICAAANGFQSGDHLHFLLLSVLLPYCSHTIHEM